MPFDVKTVTEQLFPVIPSGAEIRTRGLKGTERWTQMTSGGFYDKAAPAKKMRETDLLKAASITIDVDAVDYPGLGYLGQSRGERKHALYSMSDAAASKLLESSGFYDAAVDEACRFGLPSDPNFIIHTGHGCVLGYHLGPDEGWARDPKDDNDWTLKRIRSLIRRCAAQAGWWWDDCAKDVGTRIFPLPGEKHRNADKDIRILSHHKRVTPLAPLFAFLDTQYPEVKKAKVPRYSAKKGKKSTASSQGNSTPWVSAYWPAGVEVPDEGEVLDECPKCAGSGCKRAYPGKVTCFSCRTQFHIRPVQNAQGMHIIPLNKKGHALFPSVVPDILVLAADTGTGKTHLMGKEADAWITTKSMVRDYNRVIAITPTVQLCSNLASRLSLPHAAAGANVTIQHGSLVTCLAGIRSSLACARTSQLRVSYVMMDECEAQLQQLESGIFRGGKDRETYTLLVHVLANAGKVLLADAHAGPLTEQLLEDVAAARAALTRPVCMPQWWTTARRDRCFAPVVPEDEDVSEKGAHTQHILERLEEGKKLAIHVDTRAGAISLADKVLEMNPSLDVLLVVGATSADDRRDFSSTNLLVDCLIYTSAMSSGVSIDKKNWFDEVHILLESREIATADTVEQASHRVRHPRSAVIRISGGGGTPITDSRTDWSEIMAKAKRHIGKNINQMVKASGLYLAPDYYASPEAQRLGKMQAKAVASSYVNGKGSVMETLRSRHHFLDPIVVKGPGVSLAERKKEIKEEEAMDVALAPILSDDDMKRVTENGCQTQAEVKSKKATVCTRLMGDYYTNAPIAKKSSLAYDFLFRSLTKKVRVMAMVNHLSLGNNAVAADADIRANKYSTVMTVDHQFTKAALVYKVLSHILSLSQRVGPDFLITDADATVVLNAAKKELISASVTLEDGWEDRPMRALGMILAFAGIKMDKVAKKVSGKVVRTYFLRHDAVADAVDRATHLTEKWMERWNKEGPVNATAPAPSSFPSAFSCAFSVRSPRASRPTK
jgi:hypothetical protein